MALITMLVDDGVMMVEVEEVDSEDDRRSERIVGSNCIRSIDDGVVDDEGKGGNGNGWIRPCRWDVSEAKEDRGDDT